MYASSNFLIKAVALSAATSLSGISTRYQGIELLFILKVHKFNLNATVALERRVDELVVLLV